MRRRATQWPPRNEKATDRQGKISHLLRIILDNCDTLNDFERMFVDKMGALLNRRRGLEPATALSEKQSRTLRKIIFKRYNDYRHALPSLPAGVKFEDEVRRLLKSQPNPNENRNALIQKAMEIFNNRSIDEELLHDWPHNYRISLDFVSIDGTKVRLKEVVMYVDKFDPSEEERVEQEWVVDTATGRVKVVLPADVKPQPDPIQKAKALLEKSLIQWAESNEWWDGEQSIGSPKYKGIERDVVTFEVEIISNFNGNYTSTYEVNVNTNEVKKKR